MPVQVQWLHPRGVTQVTACFLHFYPWQRWASSTFLVTSLLLSACGSSDRDRQPGEAAEPAITATAESTIGIEYGMDLPDLSNFAARDPGLFA